MDGGGREGGEPDTVGGGKGLRPTTDSYKRHQHSCNSSSKTAAQDSKRDPFKVVREFAKKGAKRPAVRDGPPVGAESEKGHQSSAGRMTSPAD